MAHNRWHNTSKPLTTKQRQARRMTGMDQVDMPRPKTPKLSPVSAAMNKRTEAEIKAAITPKKPAAAVVQKKKKVVKKKPQQRKPENLNQSIARINLKKEGKTGEFSGTITKKRPESSAILKNLTNRPEFTPNAVTPKVKPKSSSKKPRMTSAQAIGYRQTGMDDPVKSPRPKGSSIVKSISNAWSKVTSVLSPEGKFPDKKQSMSSNTISRARKEAGVPRYRRHLPEVTGKPVMTTAQRIGYNMTGMDDENVKTTPTKVMKAVKSVQKIPSEPTTSSKISSSKIPAFESSKQTKVESTAKKAVNGSANVPSAKFVHPIHKQNPPSNLQRAVKSQADSSMTAMEKRREKGPQQEKSLEASFMRGMSKLFGGIEITAKSGVEGTSSESTVTAKGGSFRRKKARK